MHLERQFSWPQFERNLWTFLAIPLLITLGISFGFPNEHKRRQGIVASIIDYEVACLEPGRLFYPEGVMIREDIFDYQWLDWIERENDPVYRRPIMKKDLRYEAYYWLYHLADYYDRNTPNDGRWETSCLAGRNGTVVSESEEDPALLLSRETQKLTVI